MQAGLFSAVLTAFNVQSYQLLQPAATDILLQVSLQLQNRSEGAFRTSMFRPPAYAIWLNVLWFSSLIFSLASASIGIIVKQWLKEHSSGLYGSSRAIARRRQYRQNQLKRWHVGTIVASIPILLLIALFLFLAGLLLLLHFLHPVVTYVPASLTAILVVFLAVTTILPTFARNCCYHSPQAHRVFVVLRRSIYPLVCRVGIYVLEPLGQALGWGYRYDSRMGTAFIRTRGAQIWLNEIVQLEASAIWRPDERDFKDEELESLDVDGMITAYKVSHDVKTLEATQVCLPTGSEGNKTTTEYLYRLNAVLSRRGDPDQWSPIVSRHFLHIANHIMVSLLTSNDGDFGHISIPSMESLWFPSTHAMQRQLADFRQKWPPELLGTLAVLSMGWETSPSIARLAWNELNNGLIGGNRWFDDLDDPLICRIGSLSCFSYWIDPCPSAHIHYSGYCRCSPVGWATSDEVSCGRRLSARRKICGLGARNCLSPPACGMGAHSSTPNQRGGAG